MSFCSKDFSKVFPYGRFNTSITNFKLYPRLNSKYYIDTKPTSVCVDSSGKEINDNWSKEKNDRTGVCKGGFEVNVQKRHGPLFQNTTYKMTQKEQIAFFSKIGGRIR